MLAEEARKKAEQNNEQGRQYTEIKNIIARAAGKGEYEVWYYEYINPDVKKQLESEGYKVGVTGFDRNETSTQISW